jgi:glycosyltransferase involved in cell wall biosynthesis
MRILFVHQNFPGQWIHLAKHYAASPENEVIALRHSTNRRSDIVRTIDYDFAERPSGGNYALGDHFALRTGRAAAVADAAFRLKQEGFRPDLIAGHGGWGETLFLREVFPEARQLVYAEFFYRSSGADASFDPEFGSAADHRAGYGSVARNAAMITALAYADRGLAPTEWQRSVFEPGLRERIDVIHDGVDTDLVKPDPGAFIKVGKGTITIRPGDELVTFVNRNLEPYRGYHMFMRALPGILAERPAARVVIVGGDSVSYGKAPPKGRTWKSIFLEEVKDRIDMSRVHFVGKVPYPVFLNLLQVSAAHVYLTYPFVLSWSMIEAMAAGCLVIGSKTPPVEEVLTDGRNGVFVDFFDPDGIARAVVDALAKPRKYRKIRERARLDAIARYDLKTVSMPGLTRLFESLAAGR